MTQNEALKILVDTAMLAQSKGCLTLDDAVLVRDAIVVFRKQEKPVPVQPTQPDLVKEAEPELPEEIPQGVSE